MCQISWRSISGFASDISTISLTHFHLLENESRLKSTELVIFLLSYPFHSVVLRESIASSKAISLQSAIYCFLFPFPVPSRFYKFIQKLLRLLLPLPVTSIQDYYSLSLISFASSYWLSPTSHNHVRIAVVTNDIFRITYDLRNSDYTTGETTQVQ